MAMLGSECSPCCPNCAGSACATNGNKLPDTVTVTLNKIPSTVETPLVTLSVTSCDGGGSGAAAVATGGIGDVNKLGYPEEFLGPLTGSTMTNGGGGYATLARVEPVLTVSGTGEGGIFAVTLTETTDDCGLPAWKIASVKATGDLEGYVAGEQLTISIGEDDTEVTPAVLYYSEARSEPTVTATASTGEGAEFVVTLARREFPELPATWRVASVSVSGGTGYVNDQSVTFSVAEGDTETTAAVAKLLTKLEPPVGEFAINTSTGSGATLDEPDWQLITSGTFARYWRISEADDLTGFLTDPGTGYEVGDFVTVTLTSGTAVVGFSAEITMVGDEGEIEEILVDDRGIYYLETGIPESVVVTNGGVYYRDEDSNVFVESPGLYYGEDEDEPRIAYPTTVVITQSPPSAGAGAEYEAAVDLDPASPTYGQVTSLTLVDGGEDYLAAKLEPPLCASAIEDQTYVAGDKFAGDCVWEYRPCAGATLLRLEIAEGIVGYESYPVVLTVFLPSSQSLVYVSDEPIPDCEDFSLTLTHESGETVTVSSGGDVASNPVVELSCPFPITFSALGETLTITEVNPSVDDGTPADYSDGNYSLTCASEVLGSWFIQGDVSTPPPDPNPNLVVFSEQVDFAWFYACPCLYEVAVNYESPADKDENGNNKFAQWFGTLSNPPPIGQLPALGDFEWELLEASNYPDAPADPLGLLSVTISEAE